MQTSQSSRLMRFVLNALLVTIWALIGTTAFSASSTAAVLDDTHPSCTMWAESGECDSNPNYMHKNCAASCATVTERTLQQDETLAAVNSFFDLSAADIDGNVINFDQFRGKVTILTNVASYCGYTESHYKGLVELWSHVQNEAVEILAFPCNQFGKQEPGTADEIKAFAAEKGVHFRIMSKINVNGPSADLVYRYLKKEAGPDTIQWNFATYFVVGPDGNVDSFSGVEPMDLRQVAMRLLNEEL